MIIFEFKQVTREAKRTKDVLSRFENAIATINPEFGAYMPYSIYLELGTRKMPVGHLAPGPRGGLGPAKIPIGPHIRPAIELNAAWITARITKGLDELFAKTVTNDLKTVPIRRAAEQIWVDTLNAKPRLDARARAPYRYGSHRDSISAYPSPRTDSQIKTIQSRAKKFMARKPGSRTLQRSKKK